MIHTKENARPMGVGTGDYNRAAQANYTPADEIERARSALFWLDPGADRDTWISAGMAAKEAGLSFDDFHSWSEGAANYKGEADCRRTWSSFRPGGGITAATLFHMARNAGWTDSTAARTPPRAPQRPQVPTEAPKPASRDPMPIWERAKPADSSNEYIARKQIDSPPLLEQLRVMPADYQMSIKGVSVAGALAVPVHSEDGALQSIQFITPKEKLNLPGSAITGGRLMVGNPAPGERAFIVEGIGQAEAVHSVTGCAVVVAFGAGNMHRIAAGMKRQGFAPVLVPDAGQEESCRRAAAEIDCAVAELPSGFDDNYDIHDLLLDDGPQAVAGVLSRAKVHTTPPQGAGDDNGTQPSHHPLLQFIAPNEKPEPPAWLLPGFIAEGLAVIAGAHGVGKTTALLPLVLGVAGFYEEGWALAPQHWRHAIYITEDPGQAQRIIAGFADWLGVTVAAIHERLHLVEAMRLHAEEIAAYGAEYAKRFTREAEGVPLKPLVVLDTVAANVELESENDNAAVSRAVAALKQQFSGLPTWLVAHVAKAERNSTTPTARGGGAFEGDAHQVLYLTADGDKTDQDAKRWLQRGKTRFEARWHQLELITHTKTLPATDRWGAREDLPVLWSIPTPPERSRADEQRERAERERIEAETELRTAVLAAVEKGEAEGRPMNRAGVYSNVKRQRAAVTRTIDKLLHEAWLMELEIPSARRKHPAQKAFLIRLQRAERDSVLAGQELPPERTALPAAWCK